MIWILTQDNWFFPSQKTVRLTTLDLTEVTLADRRSMAMTTFSLTGGDFDNSSAPQVTVTFTEDDLNALKYLRNLAASNRTFIFITPQLVDDTTGNPIEPPPRAPRAKQFTPDTTDPILESFDLDMNQGLLILYFSETVMSMSLQVEEITILAGPSSPYNRTLMAGNFTMNDTTIIMLELGADDLNYLKSVPQLAVSQNTTFISITDMTILDMNFNLIEEINSTTPLPVDNFIPDTTPPELVSYLLDMDARVLILTFSEM